MEMFDTFNEYLTGSGSQISIISFIFDLIFTGLLALLLKQIYIRYGNALSNRRYFSNNFLMLAMTTMLIITIVKSSLALSLGLVGALSIVRFRAAIKEPEELSYLFLAISIGLGFGANQGAITFTALIIIILIIVISKKKSYKSEDNKHINLTISSKVTRDNLLENIIETLKSHCTGVNIKRIDQSNEMLEASFVVEFYSFKNMSEMQKEIQKIDSNIKYTILESRNIL